MVILKNSCIYGVSGVTESLLLLKKLKINLGGGGPNLHLCGGEPRGWHRNEGCTVKSQMGAGGGGAIGAHCVNGGGGMTPPPPRYTPLYGVTKCLCHTDVSAVGLHQVLFSSCSL